MLFGDREDTRAVFYAVWNKHENNEPLEPMEQSILAIIEAHPEYHAYLNNPEKFQDKEFSAEQGETNPFMHFGIHLAIADQVRLDNPKGMKKIYQDYLKKFNDSHTADHKIMEVLIGHLWDMMQTNTAFDEASYMQTLKQMAIYPPHSKMRD